MPRTAPKIARIDRQPPPEVAYCWDDLKIALAVARGRSLARAAESLAVDPATVSRRVAALECALGAILFVRAKTGVTPTDVGQAVIARAVEIEARARSIEETAAGVGEVRGAMRIVGGGWVTARIAGHVAPLLAERHPRLELRLVTARPPVEFADGEPTVQLWFEAPPRPGEFVMPLGEVRYARYTRRGSQALRTVAHRNDSGDPRAPDRAAQAARRPGEHFPLTATDSLILREAVRSGVGSALLPECLGEEDPDLVRCAGAGGLTRRLGLHLHPDTTQSARVQSVIAVLRESFDRAFGTASQIAGLAS